VSPDLVMVCHLAGHLVGRATSPAIPMPRMPRFALFSGRVHVMLQVGPMCKGTLSLCVFLVINDSSYIWTNVFIDFYTKDCSQELKSMCWF
jgi:hypothetical protein